MRSARGRSPAGRIAFATAVLAILVVPVFAFAHIERSSYWPDPAPDKNIKPAAGGKVPKARTLGSALKRKPPGRTRVVCQRNSLKMLKADVANALANGYDLRPTDHRTLSTKKAKNLKQINRNLFARCKFHQIQPAVTASGNNDRVVIMPGIYTEPASRAQPTNDPACQKYRTSNDQGSSAVSYKYQFTCPNDQNLIAVLGREPGKKDPPDPPLDDRNGIPDLGPCIRCNVQIEGSGPSPDNVVIDAGRVASGNGAPIDAVKDVGIRADRADGFVLRNVTVRHAREHDIYILESDGYLLDRFKTFYGGEYGVLTFVEDHGLMQNCEAAGNGDSGLYPGAGAEGGVQRPAGEPVHYTQEIRFCDSHHNAGGYSGTDGNSTWVHDNNWYDNALGFTTDVFTAPGHPGFPQDSDLIENNNFYDNNFNPYQAGSDVVPTIPVPVGTGLWIAGGNDNIIRNNHFFNNWRRGAMLFAVPDQTVCAPAGPTSNHVPGCNPGSSNSSTSYNNQFYGNTMGVAPDGSVQPNGTDFWWDSYLTNTGNCWFDNHPAEGKSISSDPANLPDCSNGQDPSSSKGSGSPSAEAELVGCFIGFSGGNGYDPTTCDWFKTPPKP